ncbi:MAG: glycosyltransferase family 4 protein [Desulfatibacillaceae bacterium]
MKICLVGLWAYSLFDPSVTGTFGGAEVRTWMLARGLSRMEDMEVAFVVSDHGQPERMTFDGVTVHAHPGYRARSFGGRALASRFPGAASLARRLVRGTRAVADYLKAPPWRTGSFPVPDDHARFLAKVGADVYCAPGASEITATIASWCKAAGRPFVLFIASDYDLAQWVHPRSLAANAYGTLGYVCHYPIAAADLVVAQTEHQKRVLEQRFGRTALVVRNPMDLSIPQHLQDRPRRHVLWIGKSDMVKKPWIMADLARRFPDQPVVMVSNNTNPLVHARLEGGLPDNVRLMESVPFAKAEELFAEALVLVNTSTHEGFPNTFLQAGKFGVPILSLAVDPDGYIERDRCGEVAHGDPVRLAQSLARILEDHELREGYGRNARDYVRTHHDLAMVAKRLAQALEQCVENAHGPYSRS